MFNLDPMPKTCLLQYNIIQLTVNPNSNNDSFPNYHLELI